MKISYFVILLLSAAFLLIGHRIASRDIYTFTDEFSPSYHQAVIIEITERIEMDAHDMWLSSTEIIFEARISGGERRGEIVEGIQHQSHFFAVNERDVSAGNRVILVYDDFGGQFFFVNYVRLNYILILGVIFLVLVVIFGKMKGFSGIVSLGFCCASVFLIFIPAILGGRNIYAAAIIVCIFSIISTLLLVIGINRKATSAMLGCFGGVCLAGILMFGMDSLMQLTGAISLETTALLDIPAPVPIDLRAIIFAGVIFGSVGAIMDVAMSIASSLWEMRAVGGITDFRSLVKSGMTIGRDTLGTMLNTLILAYIGSSLSLILLISANTTSLIELFNMEMIIVEFLRALVGSFGMLLTIPLTAVICGAMFSAIAEVKNR